MNGIEKITARILEEARAEADGICLAAEEKARTIAEEYAKKAEAAFSETLTSGKAEADSQAGLRKRAQGLHEKKSILTLKQELIARAYEDARDRLVTMPTEEYVAFLAGEAAAASESGTESILLNARDQGAIGTQLTEAANRILLDAGKTAKLTLSPETREIVGGLFLKAGDVEVNCSVDSLMDHIRDELDTKVAKELFG